MNETSADSNKIRMRLRAYLLDTASEAERDAIDAKLSSSESWRNMLEEERATLARLDALPEVTPDRDLTAAVMGKINAAETVTIPKEDRYPFNILQYAMVFLVIGVIASILLPALSRSREAARRASSQNNLKQIGLALKMYSNESEGQGYPPLAPQEGVYGLDISKLYPEFLTDIQVLVNPSHPDAATLYDQLNDAVQQVPIDWATVNRLAAESYTYIGWMVKDEEELTMLINAEPNALPHDDLKLPEKSIPILKEGIERFMITDINNPAGSSAAQSSIPVMFEKDPASHVVPGRNVLFMDGHVEFLHYGDKFPATPETDKALGYNGLE